MSIVLWQIADAVALGPGSLLGPGQLGRRYRITGTINTRDGYFAEVFSVELEPPPPNPTTYAVKVSRGGGEERPEWEHEIRVMQCVRDADCPHLAALRDHFADEATGRLCIIMERYRESLQDVLERGRPTAQEVWGRAADVARGLAVLHHLGIIHADLQLRNVFIDAEGRAVLGDFGCSLFIGEVTDEGIWRYGLYTVESVAPELHWPYVDAHMSPKPDLWALGVMLLQLSLGPQTDVTRDMVDYLAALELPIRERRLRDRLEPLFGDTQCDTEGSGVGRLAALIARLLTKDPALRPSAAELLSPANPDVSRVGGRVVARPALLQRLKRAVLAGGGGAGAGTPQAVNKRKVWGMGGVGKTTLVKMLVDDEDVRARFRDGVAWVVLGAEVSDARAKQRTVYQQLTWREPPDSMETADEGKQVLRRMLADKACLVVVDDVWEEGHADAFDVCGPEGMLLVTSRFDGVVSTPPDACIKVDVEPLDGEASLAILRSHAREDGQEEGGVAEGKRQTAGEEGENGEAMRAVLRRCGGVPLALALAGSLRRSLGATWGEVLAAMDRHQGRLLTGADPYQQEDYPYGGLWEALGASVVHLKATRRQEYECLLWYGAFMEDTWVPLELVRRVWGMDDFQGKAVLKSLEGWSMIELDMEGNWGSQVHDLLRDLLQAEAREAVGEEGVRQMHGAIVRHGIQACEQAHLGVDGFKLHPYFGDKGMAVHLEGSGESNVSRVVVIRYDWGAAPGLTNLLPVSGCGRGSARAGGGSATAGSLPSTPATDCELEADWG
jgi:hypothetical protein